MTDLPRCGDSGRSEPRQVASAAWAKGAEATFGDRTPSSLNESGRYPLRCYRKNELVRMRHVSKRTVPRAS